MHACECVPSGSAMHSGVGCEVTLSGALNYIDKWADLHSSHEMTLYFSTHRLFLLGTGQTHRHKIAAASFSISKMTSRTWGRVSFGTSLPHCAHAQLPNAMLLYVHVITLHT